MKEKIKGISLATVLIVLGIVFITQMGGWMFYISGVIPVSNTILGSIMIGLGVIMLLGTLFNKKK